MGVSLGPGRGQRPLPRPRPASTPIRPRPRPTAGGHPAQPARPTALAAPRPFRRRPHGAPGGAGRSAGATSCRCRRSGCRSCSRPSSGPTELDLLAERLLAEVDALAGGRVTRPVAPTLRELVEERRILVCCGSGGVGKTTTAAVAGARGGPAGSAGRRRHHRPGQAPGRRARARGPHRHAEPDRRRLARRALGADARHEVHLRRPRRRQRRRRRSRPSASSRTASTATSPAPCRARRSTWRWRSSTSCTSETDFDLIVVDTPPTRNALDFLDAPRRLTRFLDHRLFRMLMAPGRGVVQGRERGRPGVPAHRRQGRRRRGHRRRRRLLPGLRGHGGGLPDAGRRGARAARPTTTPPSCSWPRRGATRRGGAVLRRPSSPRPASRCGRSSSTACTPASATGPGRGRRRERAAHPRGHRPRRALPATWPTSSSWRHARRSTSRAWPRPWHRRRSCGCRSCRPTCTTSTASPTWRAPV